MPEIPSIKLSNITSAPSAAEHVQSTRVNNLEEALQHVQQRRGVPENQPVFAGENNAVFVIRPDDPEAPIGAGNNLHTVHEYVDPAWLETSNAGNYTIANSTLKKGDIMIGTDGKAYRVDESSVAKAFSIIRNTATTGEAKPRDGDSFETYKPLDAESKTIGTGPRSGVWDADLHSAQIGVKLRGGGS